MYPNIGMIPGAFELLADVMETIGVVNPRGKATEMPGNLEFYPITLGGWDLPFEVLVSVRGGRRLEAQTVPGLDGSVKHDTGLSDWRVVLSTFLANTMRPMLGFTLPKYLDRDLAKVRKLLTAAGPMSIVQGFGKYTRSLILNTDQKSLLESVGIELVVFENVSLDPITEDPHTVRLAMTFLSDEPVELIINE